MSNSLWPHGLHLASLPYPSLSPGVCSNSPPLSDSIQSSHLLSPPSPPALSLSQRQGLFQWVSSLQPVAKYWSFSISPSNEYSGLISFRTDWFDLLAAQGTLKSLLHAIQNFNFLVLSLLYGPTFTSVHDYKTIALTIRTFVSKVISLLFNGLLRFVIAFLPRSKCLLISWLRSPAIVSLEWRK